MIYYSSGTYIGGIYAGGLAITTAIRCYYISRSKWHFMDLLMLVIQSGVCIIALYMTNYIFEIVKSFGACSSYTGDLNNSCSATASYFECYGNSDYFYDAKTCAASYYLDNGGDTTECLCVKEDTSDCYSFGHIQSCRRFQKFFATSSLWALIFSIVIFFVTVFMFVPALPSYFCYNNCAGNTDRDAEVRENLINPVASAPPPPSAPRYPSREQDVYGGYTAAPAPAVYSYDSYDQRQSSAGNKF